ncbi:MAG TPA: type I-U CRISPR-associated protein Cas8c [Phycisphaerae bacterium]|nr:type I-U CRISPR-associated protein Cas8c [Phycisphaerae bacterium]
MSAPAPTISIHVDVTNPGEFFACCGLLELAHRLCPGAEGCFDDGEFRVQYGDAAASLGTLLSRFKTCEMLDDGQTASKERADDDDEDTKAQPLKIGDPFNLRLDWWSDKGLKTWAGSMNARKIFVAMKAAIDENRRDPFSQRGVVSDPVTQVRNGSTGKSGQAANSRKREPFYFDARRGASATARDIGFMPDALSMTTEAFPAVEALCLVGLQRLRPAPTDMPRVFEYCTWPVPLAPVLAAAAVCGKLPGVGAVHYRFENAFRTDQRKHKGFMPAARIGEKR